MAKVSRACQRHAPAVQPVGQAMQENGVKAGVTEKNLDHAFGGGVFPENRGDLFSDGLKHELMRR